MLVNLSKIKQFYFKSSKTQYNTSTVSLISLEFILITQKVTPAYLLQQYLHYAPVQVRKGSLQKKKTKKFSGKLELDFWNCLRKQRKKTTLTFTHTHTCKSTAQCSHLSRCHPTASLTGFILEPHWRVNCHSLITLKTSNHRQTYFSLTGTRITRNINWPTTYRAHTEVVLIPIHLNITCNIAAQKCN